MYYLILLTIALIAFFIWYNLHKRKFRSLNQFPSPKSYPFIGSVLEFGMNTADILNTLYKMTENRPIVTGWMGPVNCFLLTTDPELTEFILNSPQNFKKSSIYGPFKPWLRNGLLTSNGSYWQNHRKIATPAYHFQILQGFVTTFNEQSKILVERFSKQVDKGPFDVYHYFTAFTLDVICETAMGTSVKAQSSSEENEYVKGVQTLCNIVVERVFSGWKRFDFLFQFSNSYKVQQKVLNHVHGFSKSVIEQRRKNLMLENKNESEGNTDDMNIKKKQVLLDVLLNARIDGKPLSDLEIQEEVDTAMFAGHDTSATLLSFAMYELGKNPEVQDRVLSEVREIFGDDRNYEPTLHELNNLNYIELVLKEALRLYPPAIGFSRVVEEDTTYKGTLIPKDTLLALFAFGMHRREDIFTNAKKFVPERFLSNDFNPYAFIPFSAGARNCMGQKFAFYEAKSAIAKIVLNFEIIPAEPKYDPILSGEVILKSLNGIHVQLKHRKL